MHPAQFGFFSSTDLSNLFQLHITERIGGVPQTPHQRRALPQARVFAFCNPGAMTVVRERRRIGVGPLWMLDAVLPGDRVVIHNEMLIIQAHDALVLMLINA
ncbi:hypothetical protein D3C80_1453550 [compost metagenome]